MEGGFKMAGVPDKIIAWQMVEPGKLEKKNFLCQT